MKFNDMSAETIRRTHEQDKPRINYWCRKIAMRTRIVKGKFYFFLWHNRTGLEYLCWWTLGEGMVGVKSIPIGGHTGAETFYVWDGDEGMMYYFTLHFIKRYRERKQISADTDNICAFQQFISKNNSYIQLKHEGTQYVFGMADGIAFAVRDKGMMVMKTFVDVSRLFAGQEQARFLYDALFTQWTASLHRFGSVTKQMKKSMDTALRRIISEIGDITAYLVDEKTEM